MRLLQGDCLELMKDIGDNSVDLCLTDIPYDVVNRTSNGLRSLDKGMADVLTFDLIDFLNEVTRICKTIIIFCSKEQFSTIYAYYASKKGTTRPIIWQKSNPSPMNGQYVYLSGIETAVWFKSKSSKTFNAHCKNTVFKHPNGRNKIHPTEKNHRLLEELILDNTNEGDLVLDPCGGSFSTGVACLKINRRFMGIEKDPTYFELAKKRIEKHQKERRPNK